MVALCPSATRQAAVVVPVCMLSIPIIPILSDTKSRQNIKRIAKPPLPTDVLVNSVISRHMCLRSNGKATVEVGCKVARAFGKYRCCIHLVLELWCSEEVCADCLEMTARLAPSLIPLPYLAMPRRRRCLLIFLSGWPASLRRQLLVTYTFVRPCVANGDFWLARPVHYEGVRGGTPQRS